MSLSKLEQLYRQVIVDAAARPATWGVLAADAPHVHAVNPSCGDVLDLQASWTTDGQLRGIAIAAQGCTISRASATLLVDAVKGQSVAAAAQLCREFNAMITAGGPELTGVDAAALVGVRQFPARVKCALLAWDALTQVLIEGGVGDARNK